ncbi:MAG: hypothetical protein AB2A00_20145 [Myxococcota bacterium]
MALSSETWVKLYKRFDPKLRLAETEEKELYVQRPGATADRILQALPLEEVGKWVVCGSMGSGKSSELVHLANKLWKDHTVIGVDLAASSARVDSLTPPEVLFLLGAAAVVRARRDGHDVSGASLSELSSAFHDLIDPKDRRSQVDVESLIEGVSLFATAMDASAGALAAPAGAFVKALLGGATRHVKEGEPEVEKLVLAVDAVLSDVAARMDPPMLLVDGLDKVTDLATIRALFTTTRLLARPKVPIVYSGPITLMLSTEWHAASAAFKQERLTNVVVARPPKELVDRLELDVAGDKITAGCRAMREVVERRLRYHGVDVDQAFSGDALASIITASGGVLRDLVHLVNRCCALAHAEASKQGGAIVTGQMAADAITEMRKEFEVTLTTNRVDELKHVKQYGEPKGLTEESARLLLSGYVLPYSNGKVWFEPHPVLRGARRDL